MRLNKAPYTTVPMFFMFKIFVHVIAKVEDLKGSYYASKIGYECS